MEKTRNWVLANIEKLLDSCLLMHTSKQAHVKLHDVVRDVALWIAKEQCQEVLVDNQEISKMLIGNHQSLEDTKTVSLWNLDEDFELSKQLHFPKLEILLLQPDGFIRDIGAMESLKVLALIRHGFEWELRRWYPTLVSIPQSIVSLTNLHTLCLRGKNLGDISLLGELKGLEILDLRGSQFDELPAGIVDMKMLKLLDIFGCQIEKSPLEVIGRCEQLEELYFWDHKSVIPEILSLSNLKSLEQVFQDSSIGCSLPMLQELWIRSCPELRICIFSHGTVTSLPKLRRLHIDSCGKVKWLLSYSQASYCPLLKEIIISNCSEFEKLIDEEATHGDPLLHDKQYYPYGKETDSAYVGVTAKRFNQLQNQQSLILFLRLKSLQIRRSGKKKGILEIQVRERVEDDEESIKAQEPLKVESELSELKLDDLPKLEYIWKGPTQIVSLHKLEDVSLGDCPKLKSIFTLAIVASLPELRRLEVDECEEWEGIFCEESLKNLSSSNICFPKLKRIVIYDCNRVRWLLSYSLASHCPSLEDISILRCSELEGLIGEEAAHGDPLLHDMQDHPQQPLIRNCSEPERLVEEAASYGDRLPLLKLKELFLQSLPKLREIFPHKHDNDTVRVVKSELYSLSLLDLPELEYIWKDPIQILSFHRLEMIKLWGCPRLRSTFTVAIVTSLPELCYMEVRGCNEWEGIFCEESLKNLSTTSTVCFPKLESIRIYDCHKVRRVFSYSLASHCPSLEELYIGNCCQLERVVEAYESEVAAHHHQILFPKLNVLELRELPELREIYEGYEFNHLSGTITIEDCPNISKISKIPLEDKPSSSGW
ncbi:disease resistance protein At4g27190-like [Neltuma alba]|uniref:disease resistance protein At4g27190-like n=1 Tax=Neltuma alba TaxID=207710 RepID=UPI0010A47FB1|nr:disease resistance protein At4g27190-like [Prosopis alba]